MRHVESSVNLVQDIHRRAVKGKNVVNDAARSMEEADSHTYGLNRRSDMMSDRAIKDR